MVTQSQQTVLTSPLEHSPDITRTVQFELHLKIREMEQLAGFFQRKMLLPKKKRLIWVKKNDQYLQKLLDSIIGDIGLVLEGIKLDQETLQLSIECMSHLKGLMNTIHSIVHSPNKLES